MSTQGKGIARPLDADELRLLLESLTGQPLPMNADSSVLSKVAESVASGHSLGHSQFNELLLTVGYDRVDGEFFRFLCDPIAVRVNGESTNEISSADDLRNGINSFRQLALLLFGNVKYGFKELSRNPRALTMFIREATSERPDRDFRSRHSPLIDLKKIDSKDTYLLGYISGRELEDKLKSAPEDQQLLQKQSHRNEIIQRGQWNHSAYLTFDHLDVYVATSMRERHEYVFVNEFMNRITEDPHISDLKLRFFDPTSAYCPNRLDKGLAEALMLKRAKCTVYLAQESDTLGKDSELASTLAQGKPVIAFVPEMSDKFWAYLYETFIEIYKEHTEEQILLKLLRIYKPESAWTDDDILNHLSEKQILTNDILKQKSRNAVEDHYNKRAKVLKDDHPLGLQTNLNTGVANGVLVVRNIENCAQLIRRIVLNKMEFRIEDQAGGYVLLKEKISDCTFRVMTGDRLLTNSFWNFYNVE
ncbi:hypothetical protein [Paraburkholderia sp. UCT2]|uniref:hypothetical protein n=1 Tax=Paraburkholderia sp. UCT2 TaxID=2615208 RepID=UPI0016552C1F|nr:hypothetical protein [Paraburkholderia sp. UCT2]MBC8727045.1 hypothetical protein [Paraburkholderia sp. UCT2]